MKKNSVQTYRIGAVARLTGISPETLRVWERRYCTVEPGRSAGGGREYSTNDVSRLRLIKQLVDNGDTIGSIANLDIDALRARARLNQDSAVPADVRNEPCRVVVIGESLAYLMASAMSDLNDMDLLAFGKTFDTVLSSHTFRTVDVLVVEIPTLHADTTRDVIEWLERSGARQALVVYRYAASNVLQRLPASRIQTVQAPVTPLVIQNLCSGMVSTSVNAGNITAPGQKGSRLSISPRTYSNETLSRLAQLSPTIRCECPYHLAKLITDLVAFERYSAECENRNPDEAALHAYLHATTSNARKKVEDALTHVLEFEKIDLENP